MDTSIINNEATFLQRNITAMKPAISRSISIHFRGDRGRANANAIIQEAVMATQWQEMADAIDLAFIPIEPAVRDALKAELDWPSAPLPKGYLRGMDREMEFLDFSHFLLLTTTELPEDIAYALSWCLVEKWSGLEDQYRHIPPERSPVSYPLDPKAVCRTPIPLHDGAARYFREAKHL
jgi:uncharacterized protein